MQFSYAEEGGKERHDGSYAFVDVETTGFSATGDDRIVEVAVVRTDARGAVEDEWATLVNPQRDTGAVFVHGISDRAVQDAPLFADIADDLLARLSGVVSVAHNASFDESFLRAEFARAGHRGINMPAVCSLWLSRMTLNAPNYKLVTLGRMHECGAVDSHSALGDARTVAKLMPMMLGKVPSPLTYGCTPYTHPPTRTGRTRVVTRAAKLRKGEEGWMTNLIDRLPMSAGEITDGVSYRYIEALSDALADGRIIGDEAKALARLAGSAGLGGAQVRALNERFLEGMREAAFADDVLTPTELQDLTRAADALGVPRYFDDLSGGTTTQADTAQPPPARDQVPPSLTPSRTAAAAPAKRVRRCGHCGEPGHYKPTCPQLKGGGRLN